jgi:hypothetical protein
VEKGSSDRLMRAQQAEIEALAALPDDKIDMRDMLEVRDWRCIGDAYLRQATVPPADRASTPGPVEGLGTSVTCLYTSRQGCGGTTRSGRSWWFKCIGTSCWGHGRVASAGWTATGNRWRMASSRASTRPPSLSRRLTQGKLQIES